MSQGVYFYCVYLDDDVRSKEGASFNETETSSSGREKLSSAEIIMLRLFPGTAAVLYVRSLTAPRLRS